MNRVGLPKWKKDELAAVERICAPLLTQAQNRGWLTGEAEHWRFDHNSALLLDGEDRGFKLLARLRPSGSNSLIITALVNPCAGEECCPDGFLDLPRRSNVIPHAFMFATALNGRIGHHSQICGSRKVISQLMQAA